MAARPVKGIGDTVKRQNTPIVAATARGGYVVKRGAQIAVEISVPDFISGEVAYYPAKDLPVLLEGKKRGEIASIVPVQMLRVQFKPESGKATTKRQKPKSK
jgi:hypothetical protein